MDCSPSFLFPDHSSTIITSMTDSVGQQLRQAREARRLSLEQAAQSTRLRLHYLQALETDRFEALPSAAQARGFLRSYAQFLHLDPIPLVSAMDPVFAARSTPPVVEESSPQPAQPPAERADDAIFREIGATLRGRRELLGFPLSEVERQTHLRLHYLHTLESGDLNDLPSPVQGRGMLSNYAEFLGLDADTLLLRYAEGLQARLAISRQASARPQPARRGIFRRLPWSLRVLSVDLLVATFVIVIVGGFLIWGLLRINAITTAQQPTPTVISAAEVLALPSATPTQDLAAIAATAAAAGTVAATPGELQAATPTLDEAGLVQPTLAPLNADPIQVYLVVRQRAWVRVTVDGKIEFEGRVAPGAAYLYSGRQQIEINTGNGAALQVFYNRLDLGTLGLLGQVVTRIFTVEGMQTPTPTATPLGLPPDTATPGPTSAATRTPTPTATPRP